jgi:hypothetical protein
MVQVPVPVLKFGIELIAFGPEAAVILPGSFQ